jgi:hypothetical protein
VVRGLPLKVPRYLLLCDVFLLAFGIVLGSLNWEFDATSITLCLFSVSLCRWSLRLEIPICFNYYCFRFLFGFELFLLRNGMTLDFQYLALKIRVISDFHLMLGMALRLS